MRITPITVLMAGAFATPAFAQTPPSQSGFHVEAIGGYDRASLIGENAGGIVYGLGAGYDFQSGNAVFGIEGEATDSTADECITALVVAGDSLCARMGRDFYIGGRAGALVGRNVLLYAKAGYTNARFTLAYDDGTSATVNDSSGHGNLDGVRVGAGVQFGIGSNAFIRTEYRYSNYESGFDRHQVVGAFGFRF